MAKKKPLKITLRKSLIGRIKKHRSVARALGLRRLNSTVYHSDTPQIRGMIKAVSYLLEVEKV